MKEILLIDKPAGITSFDVIRILRRKLKDENPSTSLRVKIGHAGTLDPMATGLMIVGVGEGTKKLKEYLKLPKVYEAEVMLGLRTDTGDREGKILEQAKLGNLEVEKLEKVLVGMVGKVVLPVPMYSAVKIKGKPLYKYARALARRSSSEGGELVEPPKKEMEVTNCELLAICHSRPVLDSRVRGNDRCGAGIQYGVNSSGNPETKTLDSHCHGNDKLIVKVRFEVTSGTYIRSLAEEIGRRLGVPATLWNLRRTRIGDFRIESAEKLD
ncbi:MAG: tRNA pseudouridine(55) synthase TruB [Candidatus Liptonbacteria bacterium]|nr:tRNA pseudouridine(55) synthase TruB [Candidatus Liptonbacteria bacterium]